MVTIILKPFPESLIDAVDELAIAREKDLEALDALARLTANTIIPGDRRISVGAAFARKEKVLRSGTPSRRTEAVLATIERVMDALVAQG